MPTTGARLGAHVRHCGRMDRLTSMAASMIERGLMRVPPPSAATHRREPARWRRRRRRRPTCKSVLGEALSGVLQRQLLQETKKCIITGSKKPHHALSRCCCGVSRSLTDRWARDRRPATVCAFSSRIRQAQSRHFRPPAATRTRTVNTVRSMA